MSCPRARSAARLRDGFTLVELAIVLAIIGLLAALGGSRYDTYLDRARMARAIVELRGIAAQIESLGNDAAVLPPSLDAAGLARLDPWGNPYQYLPIAGNLPAGMADRSGLPAVAAPGPGGTSGSGGGGSTGPGGGGGDAPAIADARKDRFLVPVNSDFDLYSMGPDGDSKPQLNANASRDDVIRAANGAYYGLAEKF